MPSVSLSMLGGAGWQFLDDSGNILSAGRLYTYQAGGSTPAATYTDSTGNTSNGVYVQLDSAGRPSAEIWLDRTLTYKFVVQDAAAAVIRTYDNIPGVASYADLAAFEASLAATTGGTLVGFAQSGTGLETGTLAAKAKQKVFVTDEPFGAVCDGVTDDTVAINAAIAAVVADGGGEVAIPRGGDAKVTGQLDIGGDGVHLVGDSRWSSRITFANVANDCIVLSPNLYGVGISNLLLDHSGKTGGRTLFIDRGNQISLDYVFLNNCYTGIDVYASNTVHLNQVNVQGVAGGAGAYGIRWRAPSDGSLRGDVLSLSDFVCNCLYSGADGFVWDGFCHTVNVQTATIIHARYGWLIQNSTPSASYYPSFLIADNIVCDGASKGAMRIEAGRSFRINNGDLMNASGGTGQGSADDYGVEILADASYSIVSDIKISNTRMGTSNKSALWFAARDVTLQGNTYLPSGTTPNATYPGVDIVTPAQDVVISNSKVADWGVPLVWLYGIKIGATTARVNINGGDIYGATDRAIGWFNTDQNSICQGINSDNPPRPVSFAKTITGATTLTGIELLSPMLVMGGTPGAFDLTTPTAAQIVKACQNVFYFASIPIVLVNNTNGTTTILAGAGVTLAGNAMTMATATQRDFTVVLTNATPGSETVTIYG